MEGIEHSERRSFKRCLLLDSLKVFIFLQNRVIMQNQTLIIDELSSKAYAHVMYLSSDKYDLNRLKHSITEYLSKLKTKDVVIRVPYFMSYFTALMTTLSFLTQEKNGATESKCQSYFPLRYPLFLRCLRHAYPLREIMDMLQMSKNCWSLRMSIVLFYYHVYCDVERGITEY